MLDLVTKVHHQLLLINETSFILIVILSVIAAFTMREVMDGATIHALMFFPGFVAGGALVTALFTAQQVFVAGDPILNTLIAATVGISIALVVMLVVKRLIFFVGDLLARAT
ncbi:MAG: hypothetical protein NW217_02455 [Hyphomicrobiaceae bacterium]|nr:hypothetical protein [Hyphomicrobiaceae bacterium]